MIERIPKGYNEIVQVFGPLADVPKKLITFALPYPMLYDGMAIKKATAHMKAVDHFAGALELIRDQGLSELVKNFGGIYNNRIKRGGTKPSTHSWGIAIDVEPGQYPRGSDDRLPDEVIQAFAAFGFVYGGDFKKIKDPMHFQLCTGY